MSDGNGSSSNGSNGSTPKVNPFSKVEQMLEDAGVIPPDPDKRDKLWVSPVISTLAEKVGMSLGRGGNKLFLRGNMVMKIDYDPARDDLDFQDISESEFVSWVERYVNFGSEQKKEDEHGNEKKVWVSKSIQPKTAKLVLSSPQFKGCLPRVIRQNRVRLPVLRPPTDEHPNGKMELLPFGFDEQSGVFTFPSEVNIDETWTLARAIDYFLELYGEFPVPLVTVPDGKGTKMIRCPRGMAACIASAVALFAEGLFPRNTLRMGFLFNANMSGSGKSLLGKIAKVPITGVASGLSLSRNDDTLKSFVDSALLSGQSTIFFDNVKGHLDSQIIESLMTMPSWEGRTMHTQRLFTVKNETTILISGNGLTTSTDINRRFVWVTLQSETADPSTEQHKREIDDTWLSQARNRSDILSALWALVRHWDENGRPGATTWPAGFRAWCDVVGGIVCAAAAHSDGRIGNPLDQPDLGASAGDNETKHMRRLVRGLVLKEMRDRLGEAMGKDVEEMEELSDDQVITACQTKIRNIRVDRAEVETATLIELAATNGLFDWFLPEIPEGKQAKDVLKHEQKVKLGKLVTARSGEHPRGMKYLLTIGDDSALWRLSWRGEGRHKRYIVERDAK